MMQGFTDNCERPLLRQLQKEKFFDDDDILHPKPIYISPIEGSKVKFENIPKKVTKEDLCTTLEKAGPIKQVVLSTSGESAVITMVNRVDAKKLVRLYHDQFFYGGYPKVTEIRPAKSIKYFPMPKFEWKTVMTEQARRSENAKIQDIDPMVANRAFFPKDFKSPYSVKFTVKVNFDE